MEWCVAVLCIYAIGKYIYIYGKFCSFYQCSAYFLVMPVLCQHMLERLKMYL